MTLTSALPLLLVGVCLGAAALAFLSWMLIANTASEANGTGTDPELQQGGGGHSGRTASTAGTDG